MGNKFCRLDGFKEKLSSFGSKTVDLTKKSADKLSKKGISKKQTIVICSLLIACLVIVLIPTKQIETPDASISKIETAIFNGDVKGVAELVQVDNIAAELAGAIVSQIESKKLTADLLSYMQNELESKIAADFYNVVREKGEFRENLSNPNAVFSKTLNFLIGKTGSVTSRTVTNLTEKSSTIEFTIFRPDLDKEVKVNLLFTHDEFKWVLSGIENLPALLKTLEDLEQERLAKLNTNIKDQIRQVLVLKDFQKSDLNLEDNSFLIRLSLENISSEDIVNVQAKAIIMNKNQVIGSIGINIDDTIFANNFYERAWTIKLNDYDSLKSIIQTSDKNMKLDFEVEKVVFAQGKTLELVK
jgi:flagellar motility protein MotE (MotC chaperone)